MSKTRQRKGAPVTAPTPATSAAAAPPQPDATLKDQGNYAFASGNYERAAHLFTLAIEEIVPGSPAAASQLHLLYSNRSATHSAAKNYQAGLEDAERAIAAAPVGGKWAKGFFRKGSALEGLLMFPEAAAAYQAGLELDPTDPTLKRSTAEVQQLLSELKLTESELAKAANPEADRFEKMVRWLKLGGAKFPRLYLQYYSEDYRGVHSLSKIPAEEVILYVPHHMIMTSQVAMESPIGKQIVEARLDLRSKHSYLAAYLLQERKKGADSYWEPYINSLPQVYGNMPLFFSEEFKQAHLKGSFTLDKIQERVNSLLAEYNNICSAVPDFKQFTHQEFVWARLAVITRIFGLHISGEKTDGLVAYADMLNHMKPREASDSHTRWAYDDVSKGFTITSMKHIARGEQVYDSYGRKCNSRFFVNYGFALDDNEDDNEALVRFNLTADHPNLALKQRLCPRAFVATFSAAGKEFQLPATYRETSDRERKTRDMFAWLRFIYANDAELATMQAHEGMRVEEAASEPISSRLETIVLAVVQRAARQSLALFTTSLEQDDALLAENAFTDSNIRNCVVQRRGEKQVLRWYDALATCAIPLLSMQWADLRKLAPQFLSASARDHYVTHVVATLVKRGA